MDPDIAAIRDGLHRLRWVSYTRPPKHVKRKRSRYSFRHYDTNRCLSEESLARFEAEHQMKLPAGYRAFLAHIGDGGLVGPGLNIYPLRKAAGMQGTGRLSEPFPHTAPWNLRFVYEKPITNSEEYGEYVVAKEAWWQDVYHNTAIVNGAIPLCQRGCGFENWLVLTGPEAGNVWGDARVDGAGLFPWWEEGLERVTFIQWFRFWLNEELAKRKLAASL